MEQGLLDAAVAGFTEAADDRQPKTLRSLKLATEMMAELGPKTTPGQVEKFMWKFKTQERLQSIRHNQSGHEVPKWLQEENPLPWRLSIGDDTDATRKTDGQEIGSPVFAPPDEHGSPPLATRKFQSEPDIQRQALDDQSTHPVPCPAVADVVLPSVVRLTPDGSVEVTSHMSPYRVFVLPNPSGCNVQTEKFSVDDSSWLFSHGAGSLTEPLQQRGISCLATLAALPLAEQMEHLVAAGGNHGLVEKRDLLVELAEYYRPNTLQLPSPPRRRYRQPRATEVRTETALHCRTHRLEASIDGPCAQQDAQEPAALSVVWEQTLKTGNGPERTRSRSSSGVFNGPARTRSSSTTRSGPPRGG